MREHVTVNVTVSQKSCGEGGGVSTVQADTASDALVYERYLRAQLHELHDALRMAVLSCSRNAAQEPGNERQWAHTKTCFE